MFIISKQSIRQSNRKKRVQRQNNVNKSDYSDFDSTLLEDTRDQLCDVYVLIQYCTVVQTCGGDSLFSVY